MAGLIADSSSKTFSRPLHGPQQRDSEIVAIGRFSKAAISFLDYSPASYAAFRDGVMIPAMVFFVETGSKLGANQVVSWLREAGFQFFFLPNGCFRPRSPSESTRKHAREPSRISALSACHASTSAKQSCYAPSATMEPVERRSDSPG